MAEISDLNVTDASNIDRFPEGQTPSSVNDSARALEGILARGLKDTVDGYITTAGTSTAYTVAANRTITAYYDGLTQAVEWHTNSGASPTINIDSVGAKALVWPDQTAVGSGKLTAGARALIQYDSGNDNFMVLTEAGRQKDVVTTRGDIIRGDTNGAAERLAVGVADTFIGSDGTDPSWVAAATQAEQEAGSVTNKPVTPGRQHFHPSAAKAWAKVSISAGSPSIDASYNVSSITDNGVGNFTVNYTTALSSGNNARVASADGSGTTARIAVVTSAGLSSHTVQIRNVSDTLVDPPGFDTVVFGDL